MREFFFLRNSLNNSIVGEVAQVQDAIYRCHVWDNPKFIDRYDYNRIDEEPIVANAVLTKKAKLTDYLNASIIGFSTGILISGKLKQIIEKYALNSCQFFKSPVIFKKEEIDDYWILHPYQFAMESIDFKNTDIVIRKRKPEGGTETVYTTVQSLSDFVALAEESTQKMEIITMQSLHLVDTVLADFFVLRWVEFGVGYVFSQELRTEIESAGCTGIEFQPIELALREWLAPGGPREQEYGKA